MLAANKDDLAQARRVGAGLRRAPQGETWRTRCSFVRIGGEREQRQWRRARDVTIAASYEPCRRQHVLSAREGGAGRPWRGGRQRPCSRRAEGSTTVSVRDCARIERGVLGERLVSAARRVRQRAVGGVRAAPRSNTARRAGALAYARPAHMRQVRSARGAKKLASTRARVAFTCARMRARSRSVCTAASA